MKFGSEVTSSNSVYLSIQSSKTITQKSVKLYLLKAYYDLTIENISHISVLHSVNINHSDFFQKQVFIYDC